MKNLHYFLGLKKYYSKGGMNAYPKIRSATSVLKLNYSLSYLILLVVNQQLDNLFAFVGTENMVSIGDCNMMPCCFGHLGKSMFC